ncbi:MAG: signal peptidase II [Phycisphaerales bacterium]
MSRDQSPQRTQPRSATSPRAWAIFVLTALAGLGIDLWTKSYAFAHVADKPIHLTREEVLSAHDLGYLIDQHEPRQAIAGLLEFTLVLNPGAVFGIGAGQRWFFVIFTIIAVILSVALFIKWTKANDWVAHFGFGLIIGGGLGNLYDRLQYACVRDFIHPLPRIHLPFGITWPGGNAELWPYVSNVADAFLIVGIIMLMYHSWRLPDPSQHAQQDTGEEVKAE